MKRSVIAISVLGACAQSAFAQSQVTLSGTLDVNARYVKTGANRYKQLGTDGLNSSQLVFAGREDLGSGSWAGFTLNSTLIPDTGSASGKFWNRRSTVSLGGTFGELRLGRDYNPTFWNVTVLDPFGTVGIGAITNVMGVNNVSTNQAFAGNTTGVRTDNALQYFLPSTLGGLFGSVMIAAGEGASGNRYEGGRFGYAAGALNVSVAYGQTHLLDNDDKLKQLDLGALYDFGVLKLVGQFIRFKTDEIAGLPADGTQNLWQIGTVVPFGQSEIHASYNVIKGRDDLADVGAKQASLAYIYNLSRRTALYGTYSYLKNDSRGIYAVGLTQPVSAAPSPGAVAAALAAGGFKSQGVELGLRHFF